MMMQEQEKASEWDIDWDYTMGMPEDNGYDLTFGYDADSVTMTDNGVYCIGNIDSSLSYVRYSPQVDICNEGIFEATVMFNTQQNSGSGIRIQVSNGVNGAQAVIRGYNFCAIQGSAEYKLKTLSLNTDYTIRAELKSGKAYYYLDSELLYYTGTLSDYYCMNSRFFEQGGSCYLKALRYKKIS